MSKWWERVRKWRSALLGMPEEHGKTLYATLKQEGSTLIYAERLHCHAIGL